MRVGVNTLFLIPEEVGGTEVYLRQLLPALQRVEPGLDLVLFTNRENHDTFEGYARVPLQVNARSRLRRIWAEQTSLVKAVAQANLDLLFSPGYTAPFHAPCPQVVTVHDMQYRAVPEGFSWHWRLAHRVFVGKAAKRCDGVLTVSQFSKNEICRYLSISPDRVIVTPEAPRALSVGSLERLSHGLAMHGSEESRPFILYVANTYPHKNARGLLHAFLRIADSIPHDLVIVGQPRDGEPPPHPRLHRLHRVTDAELAGLYRACALFVFPSLYEGFGLPVLEAMASGARVLAAQAGAIPEVAGDAVTYFDPADEAAMARTITQALFEPDEVRRTFVEKGQARAAHFTWEACARGTAAAFRKAAGG